MTVGEAVLGAIVIAGTTLLTLGLGAVIMVRNLEVKVHALALAAVGPVLLLFTAPLWADGRMIVVALLLSAVLLLTSAISGHAIMTYLDAQRRWSEGEVSDRPESGRPPGSG